MINSTKTEIVNNDDIKNKQLQAIKHLKGVYSRQFAEIVDKVQKDKICIEDLEIYINQFPTFDKIILDYKNKQAQYQRQLEFEKIVKLDKPVAEKYLQDCQKQLKMVTEALNNEKNRKVYSESGIESKNKKICCLEHKIEDIKYTILCLQDNLKNQTPLKRPVGRPKKQI